MPRGGHNKLGRKALIRDITGLARLLGQAPRQKQYRERGRHSVGAVRTEFGSWNDALKACGLAVRHRHNTRVTVECENCGDGVEKRPSEIESSEYNYCSQACVNEHKQERYSGDGNPRSTLSDVDCDACGETIQRPNWLRKRNEYHFCDYDCMGDFYHSELSGQENAQWIDFPTNECERCGKTYRIKPSLADEQQFCSRRCKDEAYGLSGEDNPLWNGGPVEKKCECCGSVYEVKQAEADQSRFCSYDCMHEMAHPTGEDHPQYKGDKTQYYGPSWPKQRLKAIIRDQARCQEDGCSMTEKEHIYFCGKGLTVHHKTPREEFWSDGEFDDERANATENLITLCKTHHRKRHTYI